MQRFLPSLIIILGFITVFTAYPGRLPAQVTDLADMEIRLFELMNHARSNPLETAESLGMDSNQVLADLPDLEQRLIEGLDPLEPHDGLARVARGHTEDMLTQDYYAYKSQDGRTPEVRIQDAVTVLDESGEALGVLGFFNFIDPSDAVDRIFADIFKSELNPKRTRPRNILNPNLHFMGVGVGAGTLTLGGIPYNVYLITCDFAGIPLFLLERELLQLINQARSKPLNMAQCLGLDPDKILHARPGLAEVLLDGLPPLAFDERLFGSALGHGTDMIEQGYFSEQSLDGALPKDRMTETGYEAQAAGEFIGSLASLEDLDEQEAAFQIFAAQFRRELAVDKETEPDISPDILNPAYHDGAVYFDAYQLGADAGAHGMYNLMVADFARENLPGNPSLIGVVFDDQDADGLYDPGEGISGVPVNIQGPEKSVSVFTHAAGGFGLELLPGAYSVIVDLSGFMFEKQVVLVDENAGVWFNVASDGQAVQQLF